MARMSLEFDGFRDLLYRISEVEASLKPAADEALTEVQKAIQTETHKAAAKYTKGGTKYSTGKMLAAVKPSDGPKWVGDVASVGVGFEIRKPGGGGMHSIWIMYGTPRIAKDRKLYNAIRGPLARNTVHEIMRKSLERHVRLDT